MRIKKMYQGTVPENKILNTYSDSQTDVYSCDYLNKISSYSEEEVKTNATWIDGKPIYKRTFVFDVVSGTNYTQQIANDFETAWIGGESFVLNERNSTKPVNAYESSTYYIRAEFGQISTSPNTWQIFCSAKGASYYDGRVYMTIYYTKTTD